MSPMRWSLAVVFTVLALAVPTVASAECKPAAPAPSSKCVKDSQCCAGLVCEARQCQAGCRIGDTFYAGGAVNPANACQSCQPAISTSSFTNRPEGTACNDFLFCDGADTCSGGLCSAHAGNPCEGPDGDGNCAESCNEAADDCTASDPNGAPCSDFLFCTGADSCLGGFCAGHAGNPCPGPDGDGNCSESCNEAADNCTGAVPNGSACNDGLFCTGTDTCLGGGCFAHTGDPCPGPDGDANCSESCDEAADNCSASDPNGTACNDSDACTESDACENGACTGSILAARFLDHADGTITDCQTDLMWEKKDNSLGLHDQYNLYPWAGQCDNGALCQPTAAAAAACAAGAVGTSGCTTCASGPCTTLYDTTIWGWLVQLNAGSGFAGHKDWRIPEVAQRGGAAELESILAARSPNCSSSPCVPPAFDTGCTAGCTVATCSCTVPGHTWSAVSGFAFGSACVVNFSDGSTAEDPKGPFESEVFVRAVRTGP